MKTCGWLAQVVFLFAGSLVLSAACRQEPAGTAMPTPSPSPAVTITAPASAASPAPGTPVPAELPNEAEVLRRSQEAMMALPALGLEAEYTVFLWPGAPPLAQLQKGCLRLSRGEDAEGMLSQMEVRLPGEITQRSVCEEAVEGRTCYTQVEEQPWFRDVTVERGPSWPEERGEIMAAATVTESGAVAGDGSVRVRWIREDWPVEGALLQGESWLHPDTLLPQREALTWHHGSMLVATRDITYTHCEPAVQVETWPAPTVTPAATMAPPPDPFQIREESVPLPGVLYVPEGAGPFPAVVVLHGSEGGVRGIDGPAQRLARGGLVALAFCYFGCPETPDTLENIDIARVSEAITYLRNRPDTVGERVGLLGFSRGADLALSAAVLDKAVGAVVSIAGSPWVYGSPDSALPAAAWMYQGEPLPFAAIPVEEIEGPVLLLHGQEDNVWPVSFSYILAERLAAHAHEHRLIVYAHRDHYLGISPRDVLDQAVVFLREHLAP